MREPLFRPLSARGLLQPGGERVLCLFCTSSVNVPTAALSFANPTALTAARANDYTFIVHGVAYTFFSRRALHS